MATSKRFEARRHPGLTYDDLGDPAEPPVVLLHGDGGFRGSWLGIPTRLAEAYHVLDLDMRGHGDSDRADDGYRIELYSSDAEAFIEQVVGRRATLVGHSLGGLVAAQVAGTRPDLVAGAFFEDAPLHWTVGPQPREGRIFRSAVFAETLRELSDRRASVPEVMVAVFQAFIESGNLHRPFQQAMLDLTARGSSVDEIVAGLREARIPTGEKMADRLDEATMKVFVEGLIALDPRVLAPGEDWLAAYDREPMKCPSHMLRADPAMGPPPIGGAFPAEFEETFLATHPHATVEFVPGAGHGVHVQMPDLFMNRLERFLGGLDG